MHRATLLGRNTSLSVRAAKGLPPGTARRLGKPRRPPLALRRHHPKHRGHRIAVMLSSRSRPAMSGQDHRWWENECCVWGDLAVALLFLVLFGAILYAHALMPPPHP